MAVLPSQNKGVSPNTGNNAGAKVNGICIGFTEAGGDSVADPALGATDILFR